MCAEKKNPSDEGFFYYTFEKSGQQTGGSHKLEVPL